VKVVLLSATVPNVDEFAGWVGRTRRTVVWVTGTTKRPVQLEHALWFRGDLHTFGAREAFVPEGYAAARTAWKKAAGVGTAGPATKKEEKRALPTGRGGGGAGARGGGAAARGGRGGRGSTASAALATAQRASSSYSSSAPRTDAQLWRALIAGLVSRDMLPAVIFLFSKKKIDALADALAASGSLDLGGHPSDAGFCSAFLDRALARLPPVDRALPQIGRLRRLLRAGIGIHHSGLLPIAKEVVEMLFCAGRVRLLICAETFAMGFNGPARAVVFGSLRKHDGRDFRALLPGEYTQMAGRAGRRGIDSVGTVIIPAWIGGEGVRAAPGGSSALPPLPGEADLRRLLTGRGDPLASQFRLTYGMILGLARREDAGLGVEGMARASFAEFHSARAAPGAVRAAAAADAESASLEAAPWDPAWPAREAVAAYAAACAAADGAAAALEAALAGGDGAGLAPAVVPGRLVLCRATPDSPLIAGVVLGCRAGVGAGGSREAVVLALDWHGEGSALAAGREGGGGGGGGGAAAPSSTPAPAPGLRLLSRKRDNESSLLADPLARAGSSSHLPEPALPPLPAGGSAGGLPYLLLALPLLRLDALAATRLAGVDGPAALASAAVSPPGPPFTAALLALAREADGAAGAAALPLLDPVSDLRFSGLDSAGPARARADAVAHLLTSPAAARAGPGLAAALARVRAAAAARASAAALRSSLAAAALAAAPDFAARTRLLGDLGYLDPVERTITVKGRAACEVAAGDTLAVTECLLAGSFAGLTPPDAAALLSSFVFQEKVGEPGPRDWPTATLGAAVASARAAIGRAADAQAAAGVPGLESDPAAWAASVFRPGLAPAVHAWASGAPFVDVTALTECAEGTIVRAVTRTDEAARELRDAARVLGDTSAWGLMDAVSTSIRRDVIFAASLYVG